MEKTTIVKKVKLTKKEEKELLDHLKDILGHHGAHYVYILRSEEIHRTFHDEEDFFEAWYCGYYLVESDYYDDGLSLF